MNLPQVMSTKEEKYVLVAILAFVLLLEVGIRIFEDKLSGNIEHIYSIPILVEDLRNHESKNNIIFLGNSLTNNAIDKDQVNSTVSKKQLSQTIKITPDGTAISDWMCIYNKYMNTTSPISSIIVIGFAWDQLSDQFPIEPTRLGGFFCKMESIQNLAPTGLTDHRQLLRFLAGIISHIYVNREAIRNRVLDIVIPHYKIITQDMNKGVENIDLKEKENKTELTYNTFISFIDSIKSNNRKLIVMAMPVVEDYDLDSGLIQIIEQQNITFYDMRKVDEIDSEMYLDPIHLNESGRNKFSDLIVKKLITEIKN